LYTPDLRLDNISTHSSLEAAGSVLAIAFVILLLTSSKYRAQQAWYLWVICALLCMAVFDFLHALLKPGNTFVWLHSLAIFSGGFLACLSWLPRSFTKKLRANIVLAVVVGLTMMVGMISMGAPGLVPAMVGASGFSGLALALNILGGVFFVSGAAFFFILYRKTCDRGDLIFSVLCLLFGATGILFEFSVLWEFTWWFWHILQLCAFLGALSLVVITFRGVEKSLHEKAEQLERSNAKLEQSRDELQGLNARLQEEIDKQKQSEETLHKKIKDEEESRKATLYMLDDLSESKEKIEAAKQEWEQTFDAVADPIFLHDADGKILRANRAYAKQANLSIEELIGRPYWEVFPKSDQRPHCCDQDRDVMEESCTHCQRDFSIRHYVVHDGKGDYRYSIHLLADVTERKKAREALEASEEKYRSLAESTNTIPWKLDLSTGLFTYMGKHVEDLLGYPADSWKDVGIWSERIHADDRDQAVKYCFACTERGEDHEFEYRTMTKDGHAVWIRDYVSVVMGDDGPKELIGYMFDITEEKEAEKQLERSLEGTIQAISTAIEARDPYTAGHQQRVADVAAAIATEMGLDANCIEGIRLGATIHDIGKIQLPAEILTKPARLTEIEYTMVKEHPKVGYSILKSVEFPWPVADIAHQHHERMDGSGYPQGLKGNETCLEARIVSVADVVEAMSSHRPYRPGLGIDKALAEISKGRGELYDPIVVDACLKIFEEKKFEFKSA